MKPNKNKNNLALSCIWPLPYLYATTHIITSKIEHHAVLHVVQNLQNEFNIQVDYVNIKSDGSIDLTHLVELLGVEEKTLVSLMHVNNETGVVLDLQRVGMLCKEYKTLFHSDVVQSIGKLAIDLRLVSVDFLVATAHKFHGPKGVGFAYVKKNSGLQPLFYGGEQEKGYRAEKDCRACRSLNACMAADGCSFSLC